MICNFQLDITDRPTHGPFSIPEHLLHSTSSHVPACDLGSPAQHARFRARVASLAVTSRDNSDTTVCIRPSRSQRWSRALVVRSFLYSYAAWLMYPEANQREAGADSVSPSPDPHWR